MTAFLNSLKADLLDRRLLPFVAFVAFALIATIAYVAIGGGSSTATPTAAVTPVKVSTPGGRLTVSQTNTENAGSETTEGSSGQHRGVARNPFAPITSPTTKTTTTAKPSTTSTPSSSGGSSTGSGGSSPTSKPTTPTSPSKPTAPAKPTVVYHVAVLFGVLPPGTTPQTAVLTPFENLKLLTPLPSAQQPLLVFRGVTAGGHSATFTLVGEAILHGSANCLPSASQCQEIDLRTGQSELLEYLPASGPAVVYELKVVTIAASKASTGDAEGLLRGESKAGRELLRRDGLVEIPDLHYSSQVGVLAFVGHPAFGAHSASRHRER
jgi:hypothetical protein